MWWLLRVREPRAQQGLRDRNRSRRRQWPRYLPARYRVVFALEIVDSATYRQIFAAGMSADRRTPGVNELLARSETIPSAHAPLALTGASLMPLTLGGAGAVAIGTILWRSSRPAIPARTESPDNEGTS